MRLSRRYEICLLLCTSILCLMLLDIRYRFSNVFDLQLYFTSREINALPLSLQCNGGRMGKQMCTYATLYGLSALNHRRYIPLSCNTNHLKNIFVGPSKAPMTNMSTYLISKPWNITSYLRPEDAAIPEDYNFIKGFPYPCSFTFFDQVREEIRREFQFHDQYIEYAQKVLNRANYNHLQNATFVGIHVRRTDYSRWLSERKGVPVNIDFFREALQYFQEKYRNVIFIAVSDDRVWCIKNLSNRFGVYVPEKAPSPAHDLAILANCNHTIMTYGTFGFWGSYLAGGEVLYFDKYLKPNTWFTSERFVFEKMYPPYWKGFVTVNITELFETPSTDKNVTMLR